PGGPLNRRTRLGVVVHLSLSLADLSLPGGLLPGARNGAVARRRGAVLAGRNADPRCLAPPPAQPRHHPRQGPSTFPRRWVATRPGLTVSPDVVRSYRQPEPL